jgi:type II secretory pathway pseudopilin PulG
MNVDLQPPSTTRSLGFVRSSESGFSALELLVIVVIVCSVIAVGFPVLHSRAKAAVLEVNSQSLGATVVELAAEGYSARYRPSGEGDPQSCLSVHLEETLNAAAGKAGYMNPVVGSKEGRVILNSSARPTDPRSVPPAVFITDAPECQYQSFNSLDLASRRLLAGTLIVGFNSQTRTVDVFSVDANGQAAADVVSIPTR